ncbi:hypothetical protein Asppvi_009241 [Aspergillus pseudoviridinutans]|uniref:GPI anchored protein n=1 Tax=Aspergillus pseudoviridinutans TaxID=1517512 RepID=A0A9P3BFB8_9EURO|nr:uncharacterized protein Asppvi_009241 [Aspergillus pseudoviridinutans]GIJ90287.1 hypothetical protein Asppvi_009241 [Aspergillus pseudoviridinutans]
MQFKALATLLFAALAVANPAPAPQAAGDLDLLASVPSSVLSVLMTAIPPSVIQAFANPTEASSIINQIEQGQTPGWYASLPSDVKAWASSAAMAEIAAVTATPTASGSSAATATGATATATATSSSSGTTSSTKNTASSSAGASASSTSTSTSTSSHNAAATGAVAVSFAGAAGVLAVALAL